MKSILESTIPSSATPIPDVSNNTRSASLATDETRIENDHLDDKHKLEEDEGPVDTTIPAVPDASLVDSPKMDSFIAEKEQTPVVTDGDDAPIGTKRKVIIVTALCMNLFLAALDQSIITTALPSIVHDLGDAAGFAWCGSCFLIAAAAFITSWGKFSDIWGRKPILIVVSVIFLIGSIISALAQSMAALLAGRTIQGLGAGGIMGLVNITVSDIVTVRERGKYLAMVGFTWAIASALGPVIGGIFTSKVTWRWCFWINLPVGGVSMLAIWFFLHLESPKISVVEGLKRVDWVGSFFAITGTVLFLIGLESGGINHPWTSAFVLCLLIFGVLLFATFIIIEWKFAKNPLMPTRLFNSRTNIAAYAVGFFHGQIFIASSFYIPLYLQSVLGKGPLISGVYLLPYVLLLSFGSAGTGGFISKTGKYQEPVWLGTVIMTIGVGLFTNLNRTSSLAKIVLYQMVSGFGQGPLFQGPLIAIHATIEPRDIGVATAAFAFIRNVSAAIGVSIGNTIVQNALNSVQPKLSSQIGSQYASLINGKNANANVELIQTFPENIRTPLRDAYADALDKMWWYFFAISACSMIASAFIGKHVLSTKLTSAQPAKMRPKRSGKSIEMKDGEVV